MEIACIVIGLGLLMKVVIFTIKMKLTDLPVLDEDSAESENVTEVAKDLVTIK
jgi:hypothetical protein